MHSVCTCKISASAKIVSPFYHMPKFGGTTIGLFPHCFFCILSYSLHRHWWCLSAKYWAFIHLTLFCGYYVLKTNNTRLWQCLSRLSRVALSSHLDFHSALVIFIFFRFLAALSTTASRTSIHTSLKVLYVFITVYLISLSHSNKTRILIFFPSFVALEIY